MFPPTLTPPRAKPLAGLAESAEIEEETEVPLRLVKLPAITTLPM